jgi:hypothetical protein
VSAGIIYGVDQDDLTYHGDRSDVCVCVSVFLCGTVKINSLTICLPEYESQRWYKIWNKDLIMFDYGSISAKLVDPATKCNIKRWYIIISVLYVYIVG